jgi:hypothetical protein
LFADTMGQLVNHTSCQFKGTVVDFFAVLTIICFISLFCNLQSTLELFDTYDYTAKNWLQIVQIVVF